MAKIRNIDEVREKKKTEAKLSRFKKRMLILFLLFVAFLFYWTFRGYPIGDMVGKLLSMQSIEGSFPVNVPDDQKYSLFQVKGNVGILTETRIRLYDSRGREYLNVTHGQSDPIVKSAAASLLYYSQNGTTLTIQSIYGPKKTKSIGNGTIQSAALSDGGNVAVAYHTKMGLSVLEVEYGSRVFQYQTSEHFIYDVMFSSGGQSVFITTFSEQSGRFFSTVMEFNYRSVDPKPVRRWEIPGTMVLGLSYVNGTLMAIGDDQVAVLNMDGGVGNNFTYGGRRLTQFYSHFSGSVVLVFNDYSSFSANEVVLLDRECKKTVDLTLPQTVQALDLQQGVLYILSEEKIRWYDRLGEQVGEIPVPEGSFLFTVMGRTAYVMTGSTLCEAPLDMREQEKEKKKESDASSPPLEDSSHLEESTQGEESVPSSEPERTLAKSAAPAL